MILVSFCVKIYNRIEVKVHTQSMLDSRKTEVFLHFVVVAVYSEQ